MHDERAALQGLCKMATGGELDVAGGRCSHEGRTRVRVGAASQNGRGRCGEMHVWGGGRGVHAQLREAREIWGDSRGDMGICTWRYGERGARTVKEARYADGVHLWQVVT